MEVRGNRKAVISDYRIRIEVCKAHSDNNHVESMRVNIGFSYILQEVFLVHSGGGLLTGEADPAQEERKACN